MAKRTYKEIFLSALQAHGGRAGNTSLIRELEWAKDKYWSIHRQLFDEGIIEKGKGYGGTVILAQKSEETRHSAEPTSDKPVAQEPKNEEIFGAKNDGLAEEFSKELQLYPPVKKQIVANWGFRKQQLDDLHCEITAQQGRRDTRGSWTRPDLILIGKRKYEFLPQSVFELISFEVKHSNDISVKGVMEALTHRESATRSFVIYHTAGKDFFDFSEAERIEELASRHGVGVYAAKDINNFDEWAEIVPGARSSPDPEALDTFIKRTLSDEGKTKLRKWF